MRWSSKRDGLLISYLVGDGANIDSIANRLSTTLEAYNENFQKISNHNILADRNLNALARLGENLTNYERFNYQNTLISSVLSAGNNKRLQKSLELSTGLQRLKTILKNSDIEGLMTQLSNALLEINIPSQGQMESEVVLHLVIKNLRKAEDFLITCMPTYRNFSWFIPTMHHEHFYFEGNLFNNENRFPLKY